MISLIARFMGPTWGPSGADRTQVSPMLAPWTLLSGIILIYKCLGEMVVQFFVYLAADNDGSAFPHSPNRRPGPLWSVNNYIPSCIWTGHALPCSKYPTTNTVEHHHDPWNVTSCLGCLGVRFLPNKPRSVKKNCSDERTPVKCCQNVMALQYHQ